MKQKLQPWTEAIRRQETSRQYFSAMAASLSKELVALEHSLRLGRHSTGSSRSESCGIENTRLSFVVQFSISLFSDGEGCERTLNRKTNLWLNDFIGSFRRGTRHGEGQCFYENGIYEGEWKQGDRSGRGIMWYKDGGLYIGEWKNDAHDGAGVLVKGETS